MALIKNKRDQYLLIISVVIIISIGFIWWKNSSTETSSSEEGEILKKIEINFDFLKNVPLDNFESFSGVPELQGEISPRNPFLPK